MEEYCEVFCIYLLEKYHGKKIGINLLKEFYKAHKDKGFTKGYLWVLDDNPTIKFYEKAGGKFIGKDKYMPIAGKQMRELCFEWESIEL